MSDDRAWTLLGVPRGKVDVRVVSFRYAERVQEQDELLNAGKISAAQHEAAVRDLDWALRALLDEAGRGGEPAPAGSEEPLDLSGKSLKEGAQAIIQAVWRSGKIRRGVGQASEGLGDFLVENAEGMGSWAQGMVTRTAIQAGVLFSSQGRALQGLEPGSGGRRLSGADPEKVRRMLEAGGISGPYAEAMLGRLGLSGEGSGKGQGGQAGGSQGQGSEAKPSFWSRWRQWPGIRHLRLWWHASWPLKAAMVSAAWAPLELGARVLARTGFLQWAWGRVRAWWDSRSGWSKRLPSWSRGWAGAALAEWRALRSMGWSEAASHLARRPWAWALVALLVAAARARHLRDQRQRAPQ